MDNDIYDYDVDEKENQKTLNENLLNSETDRLSKVIN